MLSPEELKESPLFQNINYESYLAMYDCFQDLPALRGDVRLYLRQRLGGQ